MGSKVVKRLTITVVAVVVVVAGAAVGLDQYAKTQLYLPHQDTDAYDVVAADSRMEAVSIDDKLNGWFVHRVDGRAPLVIMFYGNGMCAARTIVAFQRDGYLDELGDANMLVIDYPGYGTSKGDPSESTIFAMATAAYDYAAGRTDVDAAKIIVEGYSLGTGPATYLASQRSVAGLILVAPFDSVASFYNAVVNIFHGPLKLLVIQRFDSASYAEKTHVAPLIITSTADKEVSYKWSQNLATHFPNPADFHLFDGLGHDDYYNSTDVRQLMARYEQSVQS